jgi:hypothetical protein
MTPETQTQLFEMADEFGINAILESLAKHCEAKMQTEASQKNFYVYDAWAQAYTNLMVCAEFVFRKPLALRKEI